MGRVFLSKEKERGKENSNVRDSRTAETDLSSRDASEIARLAYSYWEARGCQGGSAEEDWLRAENELAEPATTGSHQPPRSEIAREPVLARRAGSGAR
ncbi:MAG: DUF2934 domain-containing protein [Acidobacteriia bacterium]|nr:DUF2934 domain-containing protein [Terriglobia bacterium]